MKLLRPVAKEFKITSPYGWRTHPVTNELNSFHRGVDFGCPVGTIVTACFDGYIGYVHLKGDGNGAGNRFGLYNDEKRTLYFHLKDEGILVAVGQKVGKGDVLAYSGDSGRVTGPHLHFQLEDLKTGAHEEPIFEE